MSSLATLLSVLSLMGQPATFSLPRNPAVPPVIESGLPDLSTTEGSRVLLPCVATGSPKPDIQWEKDGQPVSVFGAEGRFSFQPSGELLVKNSEVRAAGGAERGGGHSPAEGLLCPEPGQPWAPGTCANTWPQRVT